MDVQKMIQQTDIAFVSLMTEFMTIGNEIDQLRKPWHKNIEYVKFNEDTNFKDELDFKLRNFELNLENFERAKKYLDYLKNDHRQ